MAAELEMAAVKMATEFKMGIRTFDKSLVFTKKVRVQGSVFRKTDDSGCSSQKK